MWKETHFNGIMAKPIYEECWKKLDHERRVHACSGHKPHNTHCQHKKKRRVESRERERKRWKTAGARKKGPGMSTGRRENTQLMDLFGMYQKGKKKKGSARGREMWRKQLSLTCRSRSCYCCVCVGGPRIDGFTKRTTTTAAYIK